MRELVELLVNPSQASQQIDITTMLSNTGDQNFVQVREGVIRLHETLNNTGTVSYAQVIEHVKEIFRINNEIFRCLKIGGYFLLGVPNILSFHNRVLGLFGIHPTQHKSYSAHLRPFSKRDVYEFYKFMEFFDENKTVLFIFQYKIKSFI